MNSDVLVAYIKQIILTVTCCEIVPRLHAKLTIRPKPHTVTSKIQFLLLMPAETPTDMYTTGKTANGEKL